MAINRQNVTRDDGAARMIEDLVLASPADIVANAARLERVAREPAL